MNAPSSLMARFQRLDVKALWRFLTRQNFSFWFICLYLIFEYVRPQSLYPALDVLPWAQMTIIACALAALVEGRLTRPLNLADGLLAVFSAIVLASSVTAQYPEQSWENLYVFFSWVLIYWLITTAVDTQERFFLFMCLFFLVSLKMSQHATRSWVSHGFRFRSWGATGAPGFFRNSGEMAIQMCIFLPLSVYFLQSIRPYMKQLNRLKMLFVAVLPVTALFAILASSSRGGQLAGAVVIAWMVLKSRYKVRGLVLGAVFGFAAFAFLPPEQITRFTEMGDDETSEHRLTMWEHGIEITNDHPVLGVGYDNWLPYYRSHYSWSDNKLLQPHNIFIEASAELGYLGLMGFLLMIFGTFYLNRKTRRMATRLPDGRFLYFMGHGLDAALVGYLVAGFFVTVLYYPFFWVNLAFTSALFRVTRERVQATARARRPVPAWRSRQVAGARRPVPVQAR